MVKLSALGEFALLDRIKQKVSAEETDVVVGPGDDAAAFRTDAKKLALLTTDMLVENVHFSRKILSLAQIGEKAISANLSDIAAMGGIGRFAVVSLAVPGKFSVEQVEELVDGMQATATLYGLAIVGGDTVASPSGLVISVSLAGEVEPERLLLRSGARPGDALVVTGHLGRAEAHRLNGRYCSVQPRAEEARIISDGVNVHAMIDTSDGLASDLRHICEASKAGADLDLSSLPISEDTRSLAATARRDALDLALTGGEDFELLFTLSADDEKEFMTAMKGSLDIPLTRIGTMTGAAGEVMLVSKDGTRKPLAQNGYEHFR